MSDEPPVPEVDPEIEGVWRKVLTGGHHHRLSFLPGSPKCVICGIPMKGLTGKLVKLTTGLGQSRKNPTICSLCDEGLPLGGAEVDVGILFADVRGSTALAERLGPTAFANLLNRFYHATSRVLFHHFAMIDKMVGDEVMATLLPNTGEALYARTVFAAYDVARALGYGSREGGWISVGIGVHVGPAFVGRVGTGDVHDFTSLGDTINVAARLQAQAKPGEVVMSETAYEAVADRWPDLQARSVALKGKEAPFGIRVLKVGEPRST